MPALNFSGIGQFESTTITMASGQIIRTRFTAFDGSALCKLKILANGVTTFQTIDNKEAWAGLALAGDVVSVVFDGQGNPLSNVQGILEAINA